MKNEVATQCRDTGHIVINGVLPKCFIFSTISCTGEGERERERGEKAGGGGRGGHGREGGREKQFRQISCSRREAIWEVWHLGRNPWGKWCPDLVQLWVGLRRREKRRGHLKVRTELCLCKGGVRESKTLSLIWGCEWGYWAQGEAVKYNRGCRKNIFWKMMNSWFDFKILEIFSPSPIL